MTKPDSLIFDMDGTLWDAVEMYVASWNAGYAKEKVNKVVTTDDLGFMMGWEKRKVLERMLPEFSIEEQEKIFETINSSRAEMLSQMGGKLYNGVVDGLIKLSKEYKLFIVSNCPENLITEFMDWAGITHLITDEMAHGVNSKPKHYNIKLLIEKYNLKSPIYIGDTQTDSEESRKAELPFVFVNYGFGSTEDYDLKFDDFKGFAEYFLRLEK
ncbi:MAG: HAD family hydrolase [Flavobacterium sp.]|nr:HAD family hydrolase [Pedobacter sp.]